MSLIKAIHHVAIRCCGIDSYIKAVSFYTDVLGMSVIRSWGSAESSACMVGSGSCILELYASGTKPIERNRLIHIAFETDDVDECIRRVKAAGCDVLHEPNDRDIPSKPPLPIRMAFCYGPNGEEIEFFSLR